MLKQILEAIAVMACCFLMWSCSARSSVRGIIPDLPYNPCADGQSIGCIITSISYWVAWIASIGFFICALAAFFASGFRAKAIKGIVACVVLVASAQILIWVGSHVWIFVVGTLGCLLLVAGLWAYKNRRKLRRELAELAGSYDDIDYVPVKDGSG